MTTPRDILAICFSTTFLRQPPTTTNGELADFALAELQKAGFVVVPKYILFEEYAALLKAVSSYIPNTPTNEDIDKCNAEREASIAVRHGEQKP